MQVPLNNTTSNVLGKTLHITVSTMEYHITTFHYKLNVLSL